MRFIKIANKYRAAMLVSTGVSLFLTVVIFCSASQASDVVVIRLKYSWAAEMRPIVQSMLSPSGTVTVSERINSLIIVDNPEAINRVRAYLDQFDKPQEQVRIHVRFIENRTVSGDRQAVHGKVSDDNSNRGSSRKKKDGVDIAVEERRLDRMNYAEFFVFTTSGQPAFIRAGQKIPYKGRWTDYTRRYSTGGAAVMFHSVESGFEVTPTIAGDLVHLRIVPRIAYGPGNESVTRFYGAQTEVTAKYGQWVEIGGTTSQSNEVIQEILSRGIESRRNSMTMSLMVGKP